MKESDENDQKWRAGSLVTLPYNSLWIDHENCDVRILKIE